MNELHHIKSLFLLFLATLITQSIHCQTANNMGSSFLTYQHESNGLQSTITLKPHPNDSTVKIICTLKNTSEKPLYFLPFVRYRNYRMDNYFRIEYGDITKSYSIEVDDNPLFRFREASKEEKLQFYGVETAYIHYDWMTYSMDNHVITKTSCFRTELKPGRCLKQKETLKVDLKTLKYIDVSIDFMKKRTYIKGEFIDDKFFNHSYKISLK